MKKKTTKNIAGQANLFEILMIYDLFILCFYIWIGWLRDLVNALDKILKVSQ